MRRIACSAETDLAFADLLQQRQGWLAAGLLLSCACPMRSPEAGCVPWAASASIKAHRSRSDTMHAEAHETAAPWGWACSGCACVSHAAHVCSHAFMHSSASVACAPMHTFCLVVNAAVLPERDAAPPSTSVAAAAREECFERFAAAVQVGSALTAEPHCPGARRSPRGLRTCCAECVSTQLWGPSLKVHALRSTL